MLGNPDEDTARPVRQVGFDPSSNQAHDLILQQLAIAGPIFIPDHQVDGQAFQAPIGMRLHHLANQINVGLVADLQQHDRQVAGNGVAPEAGLAAPIVGNDAGLSAQCRIDIDH